MIRFHLFFPVILLLTLACSSTSTVTMSVQEPAVITLPPHIELAGVMDRSQSGSASGVRETLDQVFSLKSPEMDKKGASAAINALSEELQKNNRFTSVVNTGQTSPGNPSSGVFPAPLPWETVDEISRELGIGALFSLEYYNTDSDISYSTRRVTLEGPLGVKLPALEHHAEVRTTIRTGWRIYDTTGRNIIDEYVTSRSVVTGGSGINPAEAAKAITGRNEAVQALSGDLGRAYGRSILPYWTRVRRAYYVRGTGNFKMAKRRAQTGNWDGAAELWLMETGNKKRKIAGRAHYNMAIINEINGDLENAIEWAATAYEDYGDKNALRYVRLLRDRQARAEQLRRQNR